jgi:hypothetical protein
VTDWQLAALSLLALAAGGLLVGSIGWEWVGQDHPPSIVTGAIRGLVAVFCYAVGLRSWAATGWSRRINQNHR